MAELDSKKKILIVEDELDVANAMKNDLSKEGYQCSCCATAQEAVRHLSSEDYDCVLLDMVLAKGSGKQIITYMSTDGKQTAKNIPILVVSGNLSVDLLRSLRGRIVGALIKPFKPKELVGRVQLVLSGQNPDAVANLLSQLTQSKENS